MPDKTPDGEYRDELPDDLDAHGYVGPYSFPNNNRRRISGIIFAVAGLVCILLYAWRGQAVLVNRGWLVGGVALLVLALYHFVSGITLEVNETDALVAATRTVGSSIPPRTRPPGGGWSSLTGSTATSVTTSWKTTRRTGQAWTSRPCGRRACVATTGANSDWHSVHPTVD
jgi:hypothetical protein